MNSSPYSYFFTDNSPHNILSLQKKNLNEKKKEKEKEKRSKIVQGNSATELSTWPFINVALQLLRTYLGKLLYKYL